MVFTCQKVLTVWMMTWLKICSKRQCSKKFSALNMTFKTSLNHRYFGTFCPEVEKEIVPPVSYWAALIVKIKLWWKYWLPTPRIPFLSFVISWNPIIPLRPNTDNPNYIIQMGNVFGFIISGENVLRVGIKTSTLLFSLFYAIFHSQYLITRRYYYGLWISNFSIQWSVFCSTN